MGIEKDKLVELTKLAEKARLYEGENVNLIVENYNLKDKNKTLTEQKKTADERAESFKKQRNLFQLIVFGIVAALLGLAGLKILKPQWL